MIFQVDANIVNKQYNQHSNYLISESVVHQSEISTCAIYFSSHEIYYPNDECTFKKQIVEKNRFEWFGLRYQKASKHIFLRDIKKQWYLNGISSELHSIETVCDWLKQETTGYEVVCIGSSAGGYAAVLFGQILNATKIFSFNGQMELSSRLVDSNQNIDPIVFSEKGNKDINKYFDLNNYINVPDSIFYFCSLKSEWDCAQKEHVREKGLDAIAFNTSHHGIPFLKSSLEKVINSDLSSLKGYRGRIFSPILFSISIDGWYITFLSALKQAISKFFRKF